MSLRGGVLSITGKAWAVTVALVIVPEVTFAQIEVHCTDVRRYELNIEEVKLQKLAQATGEIVEFQEVGFESMKKEFKELKEQLIPSALATPREVTSAIGEQKKGGRANFEEAQTAYELGYKLIEEYRYQEAISHVELALSIVKLPEFYLALGQAYSEIPRPAAAERALREGLELAEREGKERQEALLSNDLGLQLLYKGDLEGAQRNAEKALQIAEKVCGHDKPEVAVAASNLGQILQAKGSLEEARHYTELALRIAEKVYGHDKPEVAIAASNLGTILQAQGDLEGAQRSTEQALQIAEKVYGLEHPTVAILASTLGAILKDKGDLDGAQRYTERALAIDEKAYGPDHPKVAIRVSNLGAILKDKGDLDGAQRYAERALRIDEKAYGADHPKVAVDASDLGQILKAKGDLDGAQRYTERALKIFKARLGSNHSYTRAAADNLELIKEDLRRKDAEGR